ncbi:MAG: CHAD domain-containing protein [Myxococcales bacterium]
MTRSPRPYYLFGLSSRSAGPIRSNPITGEREHPTRLIAVAGIAEAKEAPKPNEAKLKRAAPKRRSTLPDDLLLRSDEEAARRLALKALHAARAAERRLDDRADPEALHDFRVAVRRLRSVLRAYRAQLQDAVGKKDRKRLRSIQRATGGGREAEVALEWLTKQQGDLAPEHLAGVNWLSATLLERRRSCAKALDTQVREEFRSLAVKLEERLAVMKREQNLLSEHSHVRFARALANLTEAHATDLLVQLGQIARIDDAAQLHQARIVGKRLRYLLEPIRAYVREAQSVVKRSKGLQDVLGDLNDVHVLMEEIDRAFEASMTQKAGRVREALKRGDFERARREASMSEWVGLVELHRRLEGERRALVAQLRDRWLDGELDALVASARDVASRLRTIDQS